MSVHFFASGVVWTESMKECVRQRIAKPLHKRIKRDDVDVSFHLRDAGKSGVRYSMTVLLDSREMIGREGDNFSDLTNELSSGMRLELKKKNL